MTVGSDRRLWWIGRIVRATSWREASWSANERDAVSAIGLAPATWIGGSVAQSRRTSGAVLGGGAVSCRER